MLFDQQVYCLLAERLWLLMEIMRNCFHASGGSGNRIDGGTGFGGLGLLAANIDGFFMQPTPVRMWACLPVQSCVTCSPRRVSAQSLPDHISVKVFLKTNAPRSPRLSNPIRIYISSTFPPLIRLRSPTRCLQTRYT
jgi:hypothetical protein